MSNIYFDRINRLRELFSDSKEAALITDETNIGYFCGFHHSEGAMLVTAESSYLFVDFRYIEAANKYAESCNVVCFKRLIDSISEVLKEFGIERLYFEASKLSLSRFIRFSDSFKNINVECDSSSSLDDKIVQLRIIKDEIEYNKILKAQQIAEKAYLEVLNFLSPGVCEKKIALELEYLMRKFGAERVSFDLITITGKKTSLPHGVPSDDIVRDGDFFTMDFGAVYEGYHSDTTRTVAVKRADEEMQEIYDVVLKAQLAALEKIKSGALCSEVDLVARNIIEQSGYGENFGHATGHGVGLDIHEAPAVSFKSDYTLQEGMVITDEPGIYLPDKFGVRIEDMLFVTKSGCKNFVSLPKELIIV